MKDSVKATGMVTAVLTGPDGLVKQSFTVPNLVVSLGKAWIASRAVGTSSAVMSHMAVGDSAITPFTAQAAMSSELARAVLTSTTVTDNVITYTSLFGVTVGTGAIVEAGIFNASTAGTMLCRTTFPVINKSVADSLTIEWNLTIN